MTTLSLISSANNLPSLADTDNIFLEQPVEISEVEKAILDSRNNTSPGLDGIPIDFKKICYKEISPILTQVFNNLFILKSIDVTQAVITLIFKKKGDGNLLKKWRPISLLCNYITIITKVLATRLGQVLETIVHEGRTGNIKGRSILDNLHLLRNIFDLVNSKQHSFSLLSVDQMKAFDKVSHEYTFAVLKLFNLGDKLMSHIW